MRVPTVEPRRRSRFRFRGWIIGIVVVLVVLLFSLRGLAGFYTDYLWFDSVGFRAPPGAACSRRRSCPALVFTVVFFVIMFVNLIDRRPARAAVPRDGSRGRDDRALPQVGGPYAGRIRVGVSLFFALIAGSGVSAQWQQWILFTHARASTGSRTRSSTRTSASTSSSCRSCSSSPSGCSPGWSIVLIVTAVVHYLNGGIRLQSPFQRVTPQVKAHLSVILALMALVKTAQYYLAPLRARHFSHPRRRRRRDATPT